MYRDSMCESCCRDEVIVGGETDCRALAKLGRFDVEMELAVLLRPHRATIGVNVELKPIPAGNARVRMDV
jgi:hypothetical protein